MILIGPLEKMRKTPLLLLLPPFFFFSSGVASNYNFMKKNKKEPAHMPFNMGQEGIEEIGLGSQTKQKSQPILGLGKFN